MQLDGRYFTDNQKDNSTTDTFTVRRARPILEGTLSKNFDFYIMPDFGSGASTLVDAYGQVKFNPSLKLRGGKFKAPLGLERLQSDAVSNFTEIGLPSNLLSNREVGLQLSGDIFGDSVNYAVGIFNGSSDLASSTAQDTDNNNDKDVVGRVLCIRSKITGRNHWKVWVWVSEDPMVIRREARLRATDRPARQQYSATLPHLPTVNMSVSHRRLFL